MSGILDLLNGPIGQQIISGVSQQSGQSADKTSGLLQMALPVLMGAMKKQVTTQDGNDSLLGAINQDQGGILDNLEGLFSGGVSQDVQNQGDNILSQVLGGNRSSVENALSQKSGIDIGSVGNILKVAGPILMGVLGKESTQRGVTDANGIGNLLGGLMGGASQNSGASSILTSILDADGDGSIIDDVANIALGGKKKGGLGGLLGGLFGGK